MAATEATRREGYGMGYGEYQHRNMGARTATDWADFFLPHLRPGMRLLDVGSGPGSITLDLAALVAPGEVVGIDIEPVQVERARAMAAERGISNVRFEVGSAYSLPFPDGSFDAVFAHMVLTHLNNPPAVLKEFRRVLRAGGVVGTRDTAGVIQLEPTTALLRTYIDLVFRVQERNIGRPAGEWAFQQRRLLLEAGFSKPEGHAAVRTFGTDEATRAQARNFEALARQSPMRETAIAEGWVDAATMDTIADELVAWGNRPNAFGFILNCAAVAWVDPA